MRNDHDGYSGRSPSSDLGWQSDMPFIRRLAARLSSFVLAAILSGCLQTSEFGADNGGNLRAYAAQVRALNALGAVKRLDGACISACTIFLGVKNVCVTPSANLWFHAASSPGTGDTSALGSLEVLSHYPPRVREWAIRTRALETVDLNDAKRLTGEQLVIMGVAACDATDGRATRQK